MHGATIKIPINMFNISALSTESLLKNVRKNAADYFKKQEDFVPQSV
jgi:hypothetical protein